MSEKNTAVVCRSFSYGNSSLKNSFKGHPIPGYLYKAIESKDGKLKVILPSDEKSMFGIMFDSYSGETNEYKYDFMPYNQESTFYLAPETLNYNSFEDINEFLSSKSVDEKYRDESSLYEDDFSEVMTENMTIDEVIDHTGVFQGYSESLLSILRAHSKEILSGVIYSVEYVVDRLPETLKTPENKLQILEELRQHLDIIENDEESVDFTEFCILFFSLIRKVNKGL
jgi:hypothetical protein